MLKLLSRYHALNVLLSPPQNLYEWEVTLFTSPDSEPFDGSVSLALTDGSKADGSNKLDIVTLDPNAPAGGAPFMPGGKVVCRLKGATVATPTKITLAAVRGWRGGRVLTKKGLHCTQSVSLSSYDRALLIQQADTCQTTRSHLPVPPNTCTLHFFLFTELHGRLQVMALGSCGAQLHLFLRADVCLLCGHWPERNLKAGHAGASARL